MMATNVSSSANSVTALFSDADGDSMNYSLNSARVKKVSDGSIVSSGTSFSTDTITASVTLECGTSYYWDIDAGSISDGNGGSSAVANNSSNPKIRFSTSACPNNDPVLLSSNGNSSPYDGEAMFLLQQTLSPHYLVMLMETQ